MNQEKLQTELAFFESRFNNGFPSDLGATELFPIATRFRSIEKEFRAKNGDLVPHRLAVLGSTTTTYLCRCLPLYTYARKVPIEIYEAPYATIVSEILDPKSELNKFKPQSILLVAHHLDFPACPPLFASSKEISKWTEETVRFYRGLWESASGVHIFHCLPALPLERTLGSLECALPYSRANSLRRLSLELIEAKTPNVTFLDLDHLASSFGKDRWFDEKNYFLNKQGFSFDALGKFAYEFSRILESHIGKPKKCLVLDLDNTLWGGVVGDDGWQNLLLDPNDAVGESFLAFQKYVKALRDRGVILAVCSKNNLETAKEVFEKHPEMLLRLEDISCFVANWENKANNIEIIVKQLEIGLDSLVFFDDHPVERAIVRQTLPQVEVVEVPEDPALYVRALDGAASFHWCQLTVEDTLRTQTYVANTERDELKNSASNYEEFLKSLEQEVQVTVVEAHQLARFTQLINKSNQFNLRTQRYSETEILKRHEDPSNYLLLQATLKDRFSNYGLISAVIVNREANKAFIETWVMSCRVLKRGVEEAMFKELMDEIGKWNCFLLEAEYLPTAKNGLVKNLLPDLGFHTASNGSRYTYHPLGGMSHV